MKKVLILIFCLIGFVCVNAQKDSSKINEKQYKKFCEKNPNHAYVYMYVTKGGVKQKFYKYFLNDAVFRIIYENKIEKTFRDTTSKRDELFDYLDVNWEYIKSLIPFIKEPNFQSDFENKKIVVTQIGIRYNDLHCNHFIPKNEEQTNKIKNEDARNGQRIINAIAKYFEDKFSKS